MSGCVGSLACKCSQYVQLANTIDCYTCGHLGRDHKGLGRVAVEGDLWNEPFCYQLFQGPVLMVFDIFKWYKKGYLKSIRLHGKSRNCCIFQFFYFTVPCKLNLICT